MAEILTMPLLSDTMKEGKLIAWHKKVGDEVNQGDLLYEVETDKAIMEQESDFEGTLLYIAANDGDTVAVKSVIAVIGEEGEDYKTAIAKFNGEGDAEENAPEKEEKTEEAKTEVEDDSPMVAVDAEVLTMPLLSDTMKEGKLVAWHKKVGDEVSQGDLLYEVETDKAIMEQESDFEGTLLHVAVGEGDAVTVGAIIAVIGEEGVDYKAALSNFNRKPNKKEDKPNGKAAKSKEKAADTPSPSSSNSSSSKEGRIKASPLAKKMAEEEGIDLAKVKGTGTNGRIIKRDIEGYEKPAAAPKAQPSQAVSYTPSSEEDVVTPLSQMRKTIARRLGESKYSAPHFYLTININMDRAKEARKRINEISPTRISFNDLVVKAAAASLKMHPAINSSWLGDAIRQNANVNIGVAVAVEDGLLVPVVRNANFKTLSQINGEVRNYAEKARNRKLTVEDMSGNTFTISNLGMFGIDEFTAIINPPDACIMAVGGIFETAIVKNGELTVGNMMKVTLSCDHRVVDGATGAKFLQTFKEILEDPIRLLI